MVKPTTPRGILDQVAGYLEYQLDSGVKTAVVSPEVMQALSAKKQSGATGGHPTRSPAQASAPAARSAPAAPVSRPVAAAVAKPVPAGARAEGGKAAGNAADALGAVAVRIEKCTMCALHETRTRTVPGQGNPTPEILFVGEAPGADEDEQGLAFVGVAGQLLTKMIEAMGLSRDQVFIANILKCRPPGNRPPLPEEMVVCMPYLKEQIAILKPRVIVALGATAVRGLLALDTRISDLRGRWHTFEGIDFMPTFHPSYLLRNPSAKREAWDDLKAVLTRLGRAVPPARKPTA